MALTKVGLSLGGTNAALTDPNADRILFWDDSASAFTFLTAGSGLDLTGTTLTVADNSITGAKIALGSDAAGDIMYHNGTDYIRLPKGTADQVLTMNDGATAPGWETAAGGGVDTTGTPADNQIAVFTDADTLEGRAELTHDGTNFLTKNTTGNNSYVIISHSSATGGHQSGIYFKQNTSTNLKLDVTTDGHMTWRQGTAETAFMVLKASQGGLGIGSGIDADQVEAPLHVKYGGTDSGASFHSRNSLIVERANETGIAIGTRNADSGFLDFSAPQSTYDGRIQYAQGGRYMNIYAGAAVKFKIYSNGDIHDDGGEIHPNSDERIKENVVDSTYGLAELLQLRPVDFNYCSWYTNGEVNNLKTGLIAQEVKEVLPHIIKIRANEVAFDFTDPDGTPHHLHDPIPDMHLINDNQLLSVVIKAIQELNAKIDTLQE